MQLNVFLFLFLFFLKNFFKQNAAENADPSDYWDDLTLVSVFLTVKWILFRT